MQCSDVPPTFVAYTLHEVRRNLRHTPAGYNKLQLAASHEIHIQLKLREHDQ